MEKLIIIEGNDNSGKDTLIDNLCKYYSNKNIDIIHCEAPESKDNELARLEQHKTFTDLAYETLKSSYDIVIHNRSWYGEYVYGVKYRNRDKNDVLNHISEYEQIIDNIENKYYVQLISDPKTLVNNEDGKSLSDGNIDKISDEIESFKEVFDKSSINKKIIYVTENGNWKTRKDILKEVIKFIES